MEGRRGQPRLGPSSHDISLDGDNKEGRRRGREGRIRRKVVVSKMASFLFFESEDIP